MNADTNEYERMARLYNLLISAFGEVAKFSFLLMISIIIMLIASFTLSTSSILSANQIVSSGNPILVFIALIIMLYSLVPVYDAASYFNEYDSGTYGIALTVAKILIAGVGLGVLAFISMVAAPMTGLATLLSFTSIVLMIIGNLGLGYFIYLLGEIHERRYPVPPRSLFTATAVLWILGLFVKILGLISVIMLFYISRKATISLSIKIKEVTG